MNATVLAPDRLSDGLVAAARDAVRLPADANEALLRVKRQQEEMAAA